MRRLLIFSIVVTGLAGCLPRTAPSSTAPGPPVWLRERIAGYEALPPRQAPLAVWQLTRDGAPAYLLIAPCCDQYNPLFDARGQHLCSPSGGFSGGGDMRCPWPADRGTPVRLLWRNPTLQGRELSPPQLAKP